MDPGLEIPPAIFTLISGPIFGGQVQSCQLRFRYVIVTVADQAKSLLIGNGKMKRKGLLIALGMIPLAGVSLAGWSLTSPSFISLKDELASIISSYAGAGKPIKNDVLNVAKGDGSFTWSGAAGYADPVNEILMTADTPIYIASVTKLYTATVIMILSEKALLSLDDPMAKYLPNELIHGIQVYQGHDYSQEITIAQLLAQTSCIPDYYDEKARDGKTLFDLLLADPGRAWTVDETIARARDEMTPIFKPGDKAFYGDTNYQLLGKVIEARTGKRLEAVFNEFIFHPLGLKHTWLVGRSQPLEQPAAAVAQVYSKEVNITGIRAKTMYWADGGIVSTAQDCVTFLKALNQGRIITPEALAKMHQWKPLSNPGMPFQYGYGTMKFVPPSSATTTAKVPALWGATGSTGSFLYYAQDLDLYMAGTTDQVNDKITPIGMMIKVMKAFQK
jgi:D-alanyl-D-alanine carboxypeptidase